jgi:hypothetical protein
VLVFCEVACCGKEKVVKSKIAGTTKIIFEKLLTNIFITKKV